MSKTKKEKSAPATSAVAKKAAPAMAKKKKATLEDIDALAVRMDLQEWEKAALFRAARWAPGKQVTREAFDAALTRFRKRRMGAGKI